MASTDSAKYLRSNSLVISSLDRQALRATVTDILKTNFSSTLAGVYDIINLVMALIYRESGFNPNKPGVPYGASHIRKILQYSAVASKYNSGTSQERANIENSAAAFGLMQCTGYYAIRGASDTGISVLQRARPDICGPIIVDPGVYVGTTLLGNSNIELQIIAGLTILEDKFKNIAPGLVKSGKYSDRITASIAAYLGLGASDALGTTPQSYANSIIRGSAYKVANNGAGPDGKLLLGGNSVNGNSGNLQTGPIITSASGNNLGPQGC